MIQLSQFENSVPEDLLLEGESFYEHSKPTLLHVIDKNLYVYQSIESGQKIESEILLKNKYIHKVTCDCATFAKNKWCKHIIAALFDLRNMIEEDQQEESPKTPTKRQKSTFSIQNILDKISHEELANYIQAYAKKNQKFKLDMKANFARRISDIDPETKYHKLLDNIIKPIRSKESKYAASSIQHYLSLAKELKEQMKDALSLEQYTEAFYIHKNLLQKSAYAITNAKKHNDGLFQFYQSLHDEIDTLYKLDLAPELREKLSDFLMHTLSFSYYVYPSFQDNLARKLFTYASKEKIKELAPLLQKKYGYTQEKEEHELLLALEVLAAEHNNYSFESILNRVKTEYLKNILNYILKEEKYDLLLRFIDAAQAKEALKAFPFDDLLLIIAEKQGDYNKMAHCYVQKYKRTRNQHFIKQLLQIETQHSEESLHDICKIILARKMHMGYLIDIHYALGNYEKVFELINEQDHFNKLENYFHELYAVNASKVENLLESFVEKSRTKRIYFLRNGKSMRDVFLTKKYPETSNWEALIHDLEVDLAQAESE